MRLKPDLELNPEKMADSPSLRELMAKAQLHSSIEQALTRALSGLIGHDWRFVSFYDGELTLKTNNSALATRIRLRQKDIMEAARAIEGLEYTWKLKVKVEPARHRAKVERFHHQLSKENARLLQEEAGHTKDLALREILEKLASHADREE